MEVTRRARSNWVVLMHAVNALITWYNQARRGMLRMLEFEHHFPFAHSIFRTQEAERTSRTIPHCRTEGISAYATKPENCDHPTWARRHHGNQHGRYRECQECGEQWRATMMTNMRTREEIPVYKNTMGPSKEWK